jgi:hypothetical protein
MHAAYTSYDVLPLPCRELPAGLSRGGPVVVAGCAGNSCNPAATGGTSLSTSQTTQHTEIKQAPQQSGGDPINGLIKDIGKYFGGRKLMGRASQGSAAAQPIQSVPVQGGTGRRLRTLQCVEANQALCQAWGPSQCGMPGVNDRCPCMCAGLSTGAPSEEPQVPSSITVIKQETTAVGCKDGSCNPNAQGSNGS